MSMPTSTRSLSTKLHPGESSLRNFWEGPRGSLQYEEEDIREALSRLEAPCYFIQVDGKLGVTNEGKIVSQSTSGAAYPVQAQARPLPPERLGSPDFLQTHGVKQAYMAGSMANAISGVELVSALGKAGYLSSFGSGGVPPARLESAIQALQAELPDGPHAFNLLHSPQEPEMEEKAVDLYLKYGVDTIEASAYLRLTPALVRYRVSGLEDGPRGEILVKHRVIAKCSRREVARQFMNPAPEKILTRLVQAGGITKKQAALARQVPMADDLTVEADSGGHTDNRPLTSLLPSLIALRDEIQEKHGYLDVIRVGAAGGIGTPTAALGAFTMGADYVVTGSINQSCLEAGTSPRVKKLLAEAAATDVMMAPAADMFEMGVKVQVLKRGSMFPMRAQKLFELYREHPGVEALDTATRKELEEKIFQQSIEEVWKACIAFFQERDPEQLKKARQDPKKKMSLIFRWYLGLATHWGIQGTPERAFDYQIWCGPSLGAFNDWTAGTPLAQPENRRVGDIADQLMTGAAYLHRLFSLKLQGLHLPPSWSRLIS